MQHSRHFRDYHYISYHISYHTRKHTRPTVFKSQAFLNKYKGALGINDVPRPLLYSILTHVDDSKIGLVQDKYTRSQTKEGYYAGMDTETTMTLTHAADQVRQQQTIGLFCTRTTAVHVCVCVYVYIYMCIYINIYI